jgi:transcriptional regulator of acetoin/glycerol metabolism
VDEVLATAADPAAPALSFVAASWRRSVTVHGLDPANDRPPATLSDCALRETAERSGALIAAAESSLDRLFQAIGGAGCCILLTDRDGVPLARRGVAADDETFHRWGLWPGAVWSEASEGTNGIGTCLAEERALTIHRGQHFHTRNIGLSCTVAPLHDHEGRLAGAVDVSSCRADFVEPMLGMLAMCVADATRRIESALFRQAFTHARIILAPGAERGPPSLLALDQDDLVIGATREARLALRLDDAALARRLPASALLEGEAGDTTPAFDAAERAALRQALARAGGNVSAAAAHLGVSRATLHRKMKRLGVSRL